MTQLVIGLGNHGGGYAHTRHNLGWMVLDELERRGRFGKERREGPARVTEGTVDGYDLILGRPHTYMNLSGRAAAHLTDRFNAAPADVIVIHDDLDLEFGRVRLKIGGGEGGHNGLRSVASALSTKDFQRVRIGIGRPPGRKDPAAFVLENFNAAERAEIPTICEQAADATELLIELGLETAQNRVHAW